MLAKLPLLAPLLVAAWVNYRVIRPGLINVGRASCPPGSSEGGGQDARPTLLRRFGRMLELEVTAGVLVITVAGIAASVSPPGEEGAYRLKADQGAALLRPDLPTTTLIDPAKFYCAETRTLEDLRYAEFTHNWSGVVVILLGACWLVQSVGCGAVAGFAVTVRWMQLRALSTDARRRLWPVLVIALGAFLAFFYREVV